MYSGGLDSLGTLYKLLTEPKYKDYLIHVHHVHNSNIELRDKAEAISVKLALNELNKLGFKFNYSESSISSPAYGNNWLFDTDTMAFFAGYICSVNPDIDSVANGMNAEDANPRLEKLLVRRSAILAAFTSVETIYPVLNMTKREIYDMLPESLKNKFWSCRRPVYLVNEIKPCDRCHTCHKLKQQGIPQTYLPKFILL